MVAFHDRRRTSIESIESLAAGLPLSPGDTLSKGVLGGRFAVRGVKTDEGRKYRIHEALANGKVIEHEGDYDSRYRARKSVSALSPTNTYEI